MSEEKVEGKVKKKVEQRSSCCGTEQKGTNCC